MMELVELVELVDDGGSILVFGFWVLVFGLFWGGGKAGLIGRVAISTVIGGGWSRNG